MFHNSINILRINNGFTVSVPTYPKPFDPFVATDSNKENGGKNFIPTNSNVFYFETLDKAFEYLKSIEKNIPMENFALGNGSPVMVG